MKDITKIFIIAFTVLFGSFSAAFGQKRQYPKVGDKIPPFFLKSYGGKRNNTVTQDFFKGHYYILDFWNTGCLSCIASFPKMDSLQTKFADKNLRIVLVGLEEKKRNVQDFYEVYRRRFHLKIPVAFDSATFRKFVPFGVPHLVWVDPEGTVKAITGAEDVNENNIEKFVSGEHFYFYDRSYTTVNMAKSNFDVNKPLLIDGNGGTDTSYLFRSILSFWEQDKGSPSLIGVSAQKVGSKGRYQLIGAPILSLYALAFFGELQQFSDTYLYPQFSIRAKDIIEQHFGMNRRFNYSIELPYAAASTKNIMRKMQSDLASFFGVEGRIVYKSMPCYLFTTIDKKKVSKYVGNFAPPAIQYGVDYKIQRFTNVPVEAVMNVIKSRVLHPKYMVIYNETNLDCTLSFSLKADVNDLESVRSALREVGLDIKPTQRIMRVIEITEGQN